MDDIDIDRIINLYNNDIMNHLNIDIAVRNLPKSAETKSSVALRVETLVNEYEAVPNGPSTLISSYHSSPPQFVNFDITNTTNYFEIIEKLNNELGRRQWLANKLASGICQKAYDIDLDRNAITIDVLVTIADNVIYFSTRTFDEENDKSVVEKLVQDGVIGDKLGLETESCSICLESLLEVSEKVPTRMTCSHVFHDCCISQWLCRKNSCPICRQLLLER